MSASLIEMIALEYRSEQAPWIVDFLFSERRPVGGKSFTEPDRRRGAVLGVTRAQAAVCRAVLTLMSHDVFLSYSRKDQRAAEAVRAALERRRLRVWIDNKSISGGTDWAGAIVGAINTSRVMVLIFSRHSNASTNVRREVERAVSKGLTLIPFRIENVEPQEAFELFLSLPQWIDAYAGPLDKHLDRLCDAVRAALDARGGAVSPGPVLSGDRRISSAPPPPEPNEKWAKDAESFTRSKIAIGAGTGAVLAAMIGLFLFYRQPDNLDHPNPPGNISENPAPLATTPSGLPEMPGYQRNCYDTTEDCSNFRAVVPLNGPLTFDNGIIKVDGVGIQIEGVPNVTTLQLVHLVDYLARTKTIVNCIKGASGKYICGTVGTKENVADILARIVEKRH